MLRSIACKVFYRIIWPFVFFFFFGGVKWNGLKYKNNKIQFSLKEHLIFGEFSTGISGYIRQLRNVSFDSREFKKKDLSKVKIFIDDDK